MKIQLSDHFTTGRLLRFALPSIVMMIFTSFYGVVDGIFVSNFTGSTAFASLNLVWPYIMILGGVGFILGVGGTALVSYQMGTGDRKLANRTFSLIVYAGIVVGLLLTLFGELTMAPVCRLMGASEEMLPYCVKYGRVMLLGIIPFTLQNMFQSFLVAAEKPRLGLWVTVAAGITNMGLDYLFMGPFHWGVVGAAWATMLSECVGGLIPLLYFCFPNSSLYRLGKTRWDGAALLQTCTNGMSEFVTNISMSLVNMLYNLQLMKYIGEDGVAAYGVIQYVAFFFVAIYIGYSMGTAPIVSYHYGAENYDELKNLFRKGMGFIAVAALCMITLSQTLANLVAGIFVGYDAELTALTAHAFRIYSLAFLMSGFNIYGSDFFTALNNGKISAAISFIRTVILEMSAVMLLPLAFGMDGIWIALPIAEALALIVTTQFLIRKRHVYHYA
ncbi:MAG: MATE family efflux transporter [Acutalibacteraceae bacterium]|nr:MATE family efflux transporter [Acutalibacteraceae bacterium]